MIAVTSPPTLMPSSNTLCRVITLSIRLSPTRTLTFAVTTPRSIASTLPRNWLRADIFMIAIVWMADRQAQCKLGAADDHRLRNCHRALARRHRGGARPADELRTIPGRLSRGCRGYVSRRVRGRTPRFTREVCGERGRSAAGPGRGRRSGLRRDCAENAQRWHARRRDETAVDRTTF